ncbi:MAG: ubiquitin [Clostridia bacterium]|nr:ubiquitin [Clostridia bacterium]
MTNYEMVEKLAERMNVTLEEAKNALEACDWELLDAALLLEKQRGEQGAGAYSTQRGQAAEEDDGAAARRRGGVAKGLGDFIRSAVNMGARNHFEVRKGDDVVLELPVLVLALLLIFAFWVCIPLLVIGLFADYRYAFSGEELGRESVNNAMNKAAEVAEKVKEEVKGDRT